MKTRSVYFLSRILLVLIIWSSMAARPAHAATTWVVNSLGDSAGGGICTLGDCTLRSAINTAASGDTITFASSTIGMIHLNFGGLNIAKNLTIRGPGASLLIIAGVLEGTSVFTVEEGVSFTLSNLSITYGRNLSGSGILIRSGGTLTLDQCSFFDNYSKEDGAVLYNHGTVTINRCYFGDNHAGTAGEGYGGAIENNEDGVMSITNSTFTLNGANSGGGAIDNMGNLTITNSTIKDNGAFTAGGVLNEAGGSAILNNVLLAENNGGNCNGLLANSSTHNLSTDGTCPSGFTQVAPSVLSLGALVGNPAYFPLNYGSVAIDMGANPVCPSIDQPGKLRPLDGNGDGTAVCDVGAFEAWPVNAQFIFLPIVQRH
jgi:hypothetical protein